jgi:DNA-binding SARP family transcriptional activator/TolB-like protein
MTKFSVRLLGTIEIRDAAGRESDTLPRQPKRLGLLSYLAIARPPGFHRRDKLVALFWPEASQEQARHSLTQALHVLRSELGDSAVRGRGKSDVAIDAVLISCDVVEFELAVDNGEYEKALELYHGDLLEGLFVRGAPEFEHWLDNERTRLREKAAGAAWALAHEHISAGRLVDAERTAQRALLLLATDESEIRRFIQALADAGDRAAALRFYEKFAQRLRSEYAIEPDPTTVAVSQALTRATEDWQQKAEVSGEPSTAQQASRGTRSGGMTTRPTHVRTAVERSGRIRIGVALAAVAIVVTALSLPLPRSSGEALDPNRVLVVAFADNSGREEGEMLGRWAQDHIIQVLTDAGFAQVVDPFATLDTSQNVAAAAKAAGDVLTLADEARAGTIVSGNIYAEGDSLHIQARITDANDGSSMGTVPPVVGSVAALRELVASLGQEVALALAPLLDHELGPLEPTVQPASYEAYEAYSEGLKAVALWQGMAVAARHFERAVEADSTFARARLWAAQIYMLAGGYNNEWPSVAKAESLIAPLVESPGQLSRYERCRLEFVKAVRPPRHVPSMYDATRCMVEVAPGSDDAKGELGLNALRVNRPLETISLWVESDPVKKRPGYWTIPMTAYHMLGDYDRELDISRQGLQRYSQNVFMKLGEARALAALDRPDDAKGIADRIRSLPSREGLASWLGLVADELRAHDHRDAAREVLSESIAWLRPRARDTEESRAELAGLLYRAERWDKALRLYEELAEEYPENTTYLAALGRLAARSGNREEASRISEDLRSARHSLMEGYRNLERARIAGVLGDREEAMTVLRQSFDWGGNWGRWPSLHSDIDFESLHDYPPFQEFLRPKG